MNDNHGEDKIGSFITRREIIELAGKSALAAGVFAALGGVLHPEAAIAKQAIEAADFQADLLYPSTFFPVVAKPGDLIMAQIKMPANATVKDVLLVPENGSGGPVRLKTEPLASQDESYNDFVIQLETALSPGLYNLEVPLADGEKTGVAKRPRSVWLKEDFPDSFTFAQLTDYHVGDNRGKKIAPKMDFTKLRKRILDSVAQMKPEFVLITGDLVFQPGMYAKDYATFCKEIFTGLSVPVFVTPGNHDLMNIVIGNLWNVQGYDYWFKNIGTPYHSFSFGRHRFIGLNTYDRSGDARDVSKIINLDDRKAMWAAANGGMGNAQFEWLKTELRDAGEKGQVISAFGHHTPLDDMDAVDSVTGEKMLPPETLVKTLQDNGVKNYFYGHKHKNRYDERDLLDFTCTGTSGSDLNSEDGWGFRVIDVNGDRFKSRYVEVEPHPKRHRVPSGTAAK